ncbi:MULTISPECIES: hypothetical protein [unclassified Microbacterium]|uniref:hypothetical protein n=1 Tax=unclassified Microbacterium TaxID=2609290 RepID=UPI0034666BD1
MGETKSLLNQVIAMRDDQTMDPDLRPWAAIELLAQRLDELSPDQTDELIGTRTVDETGPGKVEIWWGKPPATTAPKPPATKVAG